MNSESLRLLSGQPKTLHDNGSIHPNLASGAKIRERRVTGRGDRDVDRPPGPGTPAEAMDFPLTHHNRSAAS